MYGSQKEERASRKWKLAASSPEWISSFNLWRMHGALPECYDTPAPLEENVIIEEKNWLVYAQALDWFNSNVALEPALLLREQETPSDDQLGSES